MVVWKIQGVLLFLMLILDCLGIAFIVFIVMFIFNYFMCGFTSKVETGAVSRNSSILRSRFNISRYRLPSLTQSQKNLNVPNDEPEIEIPPKDSNPEQNVIKRINSIESNSSDTSRASKSALKTTATIIEEMKPIVEEQFERRDTMERKQSVKKVSFGTGENPYLVAPEFLMERRRYYSDSAAILGSSSLIFDTGFALEEYHSCEEEEVFYQTQTGNKRLEPPRRRKSGLELTSKPVVEIVDETTRAKPISKNPKFRLGNSDSETESVSSKDTKETTNSDMENPVVKDTPHFTRKSPFHYEDSNLVISFPVRKRQVIGTLTEEEWDIDDEEIL